MAAAAIRTQDKYGMVWPLRNTPLQIAIECIQHGGQWKAPSGKTVGAPLFDLYREVQTALWPEDDHHEWSDLILKTILENRITTVQGGKDSGKTRTIAKYALVDYFCFPHNTLILISSTQIRSLELRVWGDVKSLFNRAREIWPESPGNVVDSLHGVFTDKVGDDVETARDIRKGIICFIKGTQVDTPHGPRPIESLRQGDEVLNAFGVDRISRTFHRLAPQLLRVRLSDGRHVDCTPNHPVFTNRGWIKALDLQPFDRVFSAHEAMRLVQGTSRVGLSKSQVLFGGLSRSLFAQSVRSLRQSVSTVQTKSVSAPGLGAVLFHGLCKLLGGAARPVVERCYPFMSDLWQADEGSASKSGFLLRSLPGTTAPASMQGMSERVFLHSTRDNAIQNHFLQQILQMEMVQSRNWPKIAEGNAHRVNAGVCIPESDASTRCQNGAQNSRQERRSSLHFGPCLSEYQTGRRVGRRDSSPAIPRANRSTENPNTSETWVASVAVLESTGDYRFEKSRGAYSVYNLEVETHPSYSVNGMLVHNCIPVKDSEGQWQGLDKWCFPAGTQVNTPSELCAIEQLNPGDLVLTAVGVGRVSATCRRVSKELVRIRFKDGRVVDCTPNHRFLTHRGWKKSLDLSVKDFVFSVDDSLCHLLQTNARGSLSYQILFDEVSDGVSGKDLSAMRSEVLAHAGSSRCLLRSHLRPALDVEPACDSGKAHCVCGSGRMWESDQPRYFGGPRTASAEIPAVAENPEEVRCFGACTPLVEDATSQWREGVQGARQRFSPVEGGAGVRPVVSRSGVRARHPFREKAQRGISALLSAGLRLVGLEVGGRDRRGIPPTCQESESGSSEGGSFTGSWLASVEVLQRAGDPRFSEDEGGYPVYNLCVSGHPSYSVNGFVVHNCGIKQNRRRILADETQFYASPFLAAITSFDKGNFKGVFIGNPKGEGDPLDKLAEPKDGWGSEGEITKTMTWVNKKDGTTVQLYGLDSPAIRFPGQFDYLPQQVDMDRIVRDHGKDSAEWWMMALGIRPTGVSLRRVVTREMAGHFGAQEPVIWRGTPTTKVYAIDASYGGDRCVGLSGEFGLDINGHQVLALNEPVLIPIRLYAKSVPEDKRLLPEDQIATFAKADCERQTIPPQNVFFDSTGRGSLGTAFARIWSAAVNPVEFGGNPTSRPVCSDMFIVDDKTRQRRLERADEHYSKRVTEFWFSLRYAIEGRQIRQLPNAVLDELAAREWTTVRGNKKELETKQDTKERLGRSPDNADAGAILLEGARRLGFVISRMEAPQTSAADDGWKDSLRRKVERVRQNFNLISTG